MSYKYIHWSKSKQFFFDNTKFDSIGPNTYQYCKVVISTNQKCLNLRKTSSSNFSKLSKTGILTILKKGDWLYLGHCSSCQMSSIVAKLFFIQHHLEVITFKAKQGGQTEANFASSRKSSNDPASHHCCVFTKDKLIYLFSGTTKQKLRTFRSVPFPFDNFNQTHVA